MIKHKKIEHEHLSNTFILHNNTSAVLVDCSAGLNTIKQQLGNLKLEGILITHGHFDHIFSLPQILEYFGYHTPIYLHKHAMQKLFSAQQNLSQSFGLSFQMPANKPYNFKFLADGDKVTLLGKQFEVFNFLGHSSCSLAYMGAGYFVVGDVVFETGIGRHDFEPNGLRDTVKSLTRFLTLSGYQIVLSGHGNQSTYQRQQRNVSSFLKYLSR